MVKTLHSFIIYKLAICMKIWKSCKYFCFLPIPSHVKSGALKATSSTQIDREHCIKVNMGWYGQVLADFA
jgi:hypothetical protein